MNPAGGPVLYFFGQSVGPLSLVNKDQSFLSEIQFINRRDDPPDLFVHLFEDGEEIANIRVVGNRFEFVGTTGKWHVRVVNVVRKQPHVERAVAVPPNEIDRAICLDLHPLPALAGNDLSLAKSPRPFDALRVGNNSIAQAFEGNQRFVESVSLWQEERRPHHDRLPYAICRNERSRSQQLSASSRSSVRRRRGS